MNFTLNKNFWLKISFCCFISISSYAQKKIEKKAEQNFNNNAYFEAIKVYEKIADKGYINTSILMKLGDSYYFNGKLADASKWYSMLFNGEYDDRNIYLIPSEYYYRYAQCLKSLKQYDEADKMLDQFANLEKDDLRARLFEQSKTTYLSDINNHYEEYEIKNLAFNSPFSDYGGTVYNNAVIYTSARATGTSGSRIHDWTNESFTSLYQVRIDANWVLENPTQFAKHIEVNKINFASPAFTKDGRTMYFTKNNSSTSGKGIFNKDSSSLLKIYKATLDDSGIWGNVQALPFNSDSFSCAHPALSPDGKWMYFSSDREGTLGSSDIFRVELLGNNTYGVVENLGASINTEGKETFAFISEDNMLYFSTDGHPGLGGLDVFRAQILSNGSFGKVENLGAPINSPFDDFAFYFNEKLSKGFVSSNRPGGKGGDDVYLVSKETGIKVLPGNVVDLTEKTPVENAKITVYDSNYNEVATGISDASGNFELHNLKQHTKYRINVEAPGYLTSEIVYVTKTASDSPALIIEFEREKIPVTIKDDLFKKLNLKPIYFDFDKSTIRKDAVLELVKIVEVMRSVPQMKIEVKSHTDNRGSAAYNLKLSQERAASTASWIITQGIDPSRVSFVGMGDTEPLIICGYCTEREYQVNRRSEFIVKEL